MWTKKEILVGNNLNLDLNSAFNMTNIKGYDFEIDKLYERNGIGRTGIWIDTMLVYDRYSELEMEGESIIA